MEQRDYCYGASGHSTCCRLVDRFHLKGAQLKKNKNNVILAALNTDIAENSQKCTFYDNFGTKYTI